MIVLDEATDLMKEVLPELNPSEDAYNKVKSVFVKNELFAKQKRGIYCARFSQYIPRFASVVKRSRTSYELPPSCLRHATSLTEGGSDRPPP